MEVRGTADTLTSAAPWGKRPVATIGVIDGDDNQIFGRIATAKIDADGNVVILDALALDLRLFKTDGTLLARVGGVGSGPGKFRAPFDVDTDESNRILVVDGPLRRITTLAWDSGALQVAATLPINRFAVQLCVSPPGYFVLHDSREDGGLLHEIDGEGRTVHSFGELITEVPPELLKLGFYSSGHYWGRLYCDSVTGNLYVQHTEVPYVRAFNHDGKEIWRTRLVDFQPTVWRVVQAGSSPIFGQGPDPRTGMSDAGGGIFRWSPGILGIAIRRHIAVPSEKWQYQLRFVRDDTGQEIGRFEAPMVITAVNKKYVYGYVNEPYPHVMIFPRRPAVVGVGTR